MKLFYLHIRKKWGIEFTGLLIYKGLDTANSNPNNPLVHKYFNNVQRDCSPYSSIKFPFHCKNKTIIF